MYHFQATFTTTHAAPSCKCVMIQASHCRYLQRVCADACAELMLRVCNVSEGHALYQSGPPCYCDLGSICNLTTPEAATEEQGGTPPCVDTLPPPRGGKPNALRNCAHTHTHPGRCRRGDSWTFLSTAENDPQPFSSDVKGRKCPPVGTHRGVPPTPPPLPTPSFPLLPHQQDATHMLVLAVDVSHSPARPMMSRPDDSWLKKRG